MMRKQKTTFVERLLGGERRPPYHRGRGSGKSKYEASMHVTTHLILLAWDLGPRIASVLKFDRADF